MTDKSAMYPAISSQIFFPHRFGDSYAAFMKDAGVEAVELYAVAPHVDFNDPVRFDEVKEALLSKGIAVASVHAPYSDVTRRGELMTISDRDPKRRRKAVDAIKLCLQAADALRSGRVVAHFARYNDRDDSQTVESILSSLVDIDGFAATTRARVAFENIGGAVSNTEYMMELFARYDFHRFDICLDIAHANIAEDPLAAIDKCGHRLKHVHISDNDGVSDQHKLPMDGSIDWGAVMAGLRRVGYAGPVVIEHRPSPAPTVILHKMMERWRALAEMKEEA